MPDASVPGAVTSLMAPARDGLTPPNYRLTIPISSQETTVSLILPPQGQMKGYVWAERLYDLFGANDLIKIGQAFAELLGELVTVTDNYQACLANAGWLGKIGCTTGYVGNITFALTRFGLKALTPGVIEAAYNLVAQAWEADQAVTSLSGAWNRGTRQFTIAAAASSPTSSGPGSSSHSPSPSRGSGGSGGSTPPPVPINAYDNYGPANAGRAMCRGNTGDPVSMPGGTASQTFIVPSGVASLSAALVQIDPDSTVTAHLTVYVDGTPEASAAAVAVGDTRFSFGPITVTPGETVTISITFTATYGKIITVYTAGTPGGTFTASNSCPDGAPSLSTTSTGLRAVFSGMS